MSKLNNSVFNRLFTRNILLELIETERATGLYKEAIGRIKVDCQGKENQFVIKEIYSFMAKSYRNEYFYINTLFNKIVLGRHSLSTTTALTQLPVGKSKADLVLINYGAIVFEIKTELDSFDRLQSQINDYYKAFDSVCVVTSEGQYPKIESMLKNSPVGILILNDKNRLSEQYRKKPLSYRLGLSHETLFKLLRKSEYENLLMECYGRVPKVPPVFYYDECYKLFCDIPIDKAQVMVMHMLKQRNNKSQNELLKVPYELRALVYFANASERHLGKLKRFLNSKYRG